MELRPSNIALGITTLFLAVILYFLFYSCDRLIILNLNLQQQNHGFIKQ
jgi:hypothetical protein